MSIEFGSMLEFAEKEIENSSRIERYPFRNRYAHTLRVLKWAKRIHSAEGGNWEIIKIACIFHDIGWDQEINHSIISKEIAEKYLKENKYEKEKLKLVLEAIENHNMRNNENITGIESKIVMDADILDEVGATSIIWDSMASQMEGRTSYNDVYERIKFYINRMNKIGLLKTSTGKKFFAERIKFIARFIEELEYELF